MFGLCPHSLLLAAFCLLSVGSGTAIAQDTRLSTTTAPAPRSLRVQHNGVDHGTAGGCLVNAQTGTKDPGGILGPLYAAFPGLLAPLAMASDTIHNTNAALTGVQHTPDGIFQAKESIRLRNIGDDQRYAIAPDCTPADHEEERRLASTTTTINISNAPVRYMSCLACMRLLPRSASQFPIAIFQSNPPPHPRLPSQSTIMRSISSVALCLAVLLAVSSVDAHDVIASPAPSPPARNLRAEQWTTFSSTTQPIVMNSPDGSSTVVVGPTVAMGGFFNPFGLLRGMFGRSGRE